MQDSPQRAREGRRAARFEAPDAALREKIEDKLWAIHDENTEFVTRAMEAGTALTRIFEDAVASGAISIDDMFDADYVEIAGTNPVQHRTRILELGGSRAACRSRRLSSPRIRAWCSAR